MLRSTRFLVIGKSITVDGNGILSSVDFGVHFKKNQGGAVYETTTTDDTKPIFVYSSGPTFIDSHRSTKYQFELFRTPAGDLYYREGYRPAADDDALEAMKQESPEVHAKLMSWTDNAVTRPVPEEKCAQVLKILHGMRPPRNQHTRETVSETDRIARITPLPPDYDFMDGMVLDGAMYTVAVNLTERQFSCVWFQGQYSDQYPKYESRRIIKELTGHDAVW
jgi:hypothetical protein